MLQASRTLLRILSLLKIPYMLLLRTLLFVVRPIIGVIISTAVIPEE